MASDISLAVGYGTRRMTSAARTERTPPPQAPGQPTCPPGLSACPDRRTEGARITRAIDGEAVIAEFIRTRGITRCPTACVLPTQGSVSAADRTALQEHAVVQERLRQTRAAARLTLYGPR